MRCGGWLAGLCVCAAGFKQGGGGAKASAKWEDEENWSKESDYF